MRILRTVGTVALWIVNILAAAAFAAIGLAKFGSPAWAIKFERWGYPDGFYMVIGALELAGGVLLLVPSVSSYAAALLGAILLGAAATHALHGETTRVAAPLMWLAVMTLIGVAIAHELGHLLGLKHGEGIMGPRLGPEQIVQLRKGRLGFSHLDAAKMNALATALLLPAGDVPNPARDKPLRP